jgi:hypothetical protein
MGGLVAGMLRVGVSVGFAMGVSVAVQALGLLEIMPLAGTKTEYDQDGE